MFLARRDWSEVYQRAEVFYFQGSDVMRSITERIMSVRLTIGSISIIEKRKLEVVFIGCIESIFNISKKDRVCSRSGKKPFLNHISTYI